MNNKIRTAFLCMQEARELADTFPKNSPLWKYYKSLSDNLGDLSSGTYEDKGIPFSCSREIDILPHGQDFNDAWAKEITEAGMIILSITDHLLKEHLSRE